MIEGILVCYSWVSQRTLVSKSLLQMLADGCNSFRYRTILVTNFICSPDIAFYVHLLVMSNPWTVFCLCLSKASSTTLNTNHLSYLCSYTLKKRDYKKLHFLRSLMWSLLHGALRLMALWISSLSQHMMSLDQSLSTWGRLAMIHQGSPHICCPT